MRPFFARRTSWDLAPNRYTLALEAHRKAGKELLDLTASNPTTVGLRYDEDRLLRAIANRESLIYDPQPKGLLKAREAVTAYYAEKGCTVPAGDILLTASTSEAYSFVFRLLCDPGDAVLVPAPSYPLFDFLADLQDVKLARYELVYDHGWQLDFHSLESALRKLASEATACRAVLVVHPNNPTGSYVTERELGELKRVCADGAMAIIADEVFLDYALADAPPLTFASNHATLTFTLSGLSKISALPQMKAAWLAVSGPEELKGDALQRLEVIADTFLSMNAPVQHTFPEMLCQRGEIQRQLIERIRSNLADLDGQLARQELSHRLEVQGGWYVVLRIPAKEPDEDVAVRLLEKTGVLVQPGHFYDFAREGHVILSLITPAETFSAGVRRLLQFVTEE